jgi:glutathione S-transferase
MKLYYAPNTRAVRPRWLLEEAGAPYELVRLDLSQRQHKAPEYRALHPHGKVPTLVDGELTLIESTAICLHLADHLPGLAPPLGSPERGRYYQWMIYAIATVEPQVVELARLKRSGAAPSDDARTLWAETLAFIERSLGEGPFILGGALCAADVVLGSMLVWAQSLGPFVEHPRLVAYCERLRAREAYQRARA